MNVDNVRRCSCHVYPRLDVLDVVNYTVVVVFPHCGLFTLQSDVPMYEKCDFLTIMQMHEREAIESD